MSFHSDNHNTPADQPFRAVGTGHVSLRLCSKCQTPRSCIGGRGKSPRWICAQCAAAKGGK